MPNSKHGDAPWYSSTLYSSPRDEHTTVPMSRFARSGMPRRRSHCGDVLDGAATATAASNVHKSITQFFLYCTYTKLPVHIRRSVLLSACVRLFWSKKGSACFHRAACVLGDPVMCADGCKAKRAAAHRQRNNHHGVRRRHDLANERAGDDRGACDLGVAARKCEQS